MSKLSHKSHYDTAPPAYKYQSIYTKTSYPTQPLLRQAGYYPSEPLDSLTSFNNHSIARESAHEPRKPVGKDRNPLRHTLYDGRAGKNDGNREKCATSSNLARKHKKENSDLQTPLFTIANVEDRGQDHRFRTAYYGKE